MLLRRLTPLLQPIARWYLKVPRSYRHNGIRLTIRPGVFHPGFFFSTRILLLYAKKLDLKGRSVLELGAGSGLISIWCALHGAAVTATDISPEAIQSLHENARRNGVFLQVVQSDLFKELERQRFDFILINPPYYPREPHTVAERAWFCGPDHEYFTQLFIQLRPRIAAGSIVVMVLSEACDLRTISGKARENFLNLTEVFRKRAWGETNYVFSVTAE
jgi:release factor glutamine methyltransferase